MGISSELKRAYSTEPKPIAVAKSLKGRDSGRLFLVLGKDEKTVLIADGKLHKLAKPKLKNLRHVKYLPEGVLGSVPNLYGEFGLTDAGVRRALAFIREKGGT